MALEDRRRNEPLAAFLDADARGSDLTPALLATMESTRQALDPMEASIRRLERGVRGLCGSEAGKSRRGAYDRRVPTWDMSALHAMGHQAVVAGIGDAMDPGGAARNAQRPRADARLSAERLRDALRGPDVGLLVGMLDSL
jgi:hypothetical protein